MSRVEFIDRYLKRWVSRKLLVFIVATIGMFLGKITSSDWVIISTAYIAIQGISDTVVKLFNSRGNSGDL